MIGVIWWLIGYDSFALGGVILLFILFIGNCMDKTSRHHPKTKEPEKKETAEERSRRILGGDLYESQLRILQDLFFCSVNRNTKKLSNILTLSVKRNT